MTFSRLGQNRRALVVQTNFSPFGNKLIQGGHITPEQMLQAQEESRKSGRPLPDIIESLTGQQLPPELVRQYKRQQLFELKLLHGVEAFDPEIEELSTAQLNPLMELIPLDSCRRYRFVPISRQKEDLPSVVVAMVEPENLEAQDELKRILRSSGFRLQRRVIALEDYQKLISLCLDEQERKEAAIAAQKQDEKNAIGADAFAQFADGEGDLEEAPAEGMDLDGSDDADSQPIVNTVNKILRKALSEGVSDIHVEPQEEHLQIRMRKDGVLQEPFPRLPKSIIPAITSRFKIISDMDIAERRQAQDGRIRRVFQGRTVDFRVSALPSRYGEKIVLRILDNSSTQLGLDKLISDEETLEKVRDVASRPFGLILVTGPTGSGKSTTLYSVLAERNDPGVNISTAEDPIEYALPGITQCQVIREKDLTFSNILRAFLRQDPDIILVGETRDKETAKTAMEAALTGHLVLTTLHTNDAAGAIARLDEMGVEPFMISGALLGVLAQRLMRRVCSECRITYTPSVDELNRFGLSTSGEATTEFYKANTIPPSDRKALLESGQLCEKCAGVGYKGRVGVYEFLQNSEELAALINQGAPTERISEKAVEQGMKTLLAYSLDLVRQGHTTFEEVERVTFTDSGLEAELKARRKSSLTCSTCGAAVEPDWMDCTYCMTPRFQD
ncbi:type II/IV secretion system protein [Oscillatoriales cyanobacterium LEGE 11467]|uniref:Type II/IV secretion system protein n=1 Tax=Zarconia navalis LEGE 11467 TaxID=1828826 RepID=A0A928VY95_9CYAN|nr:GspE/PulE family protein [Zarconia navalis]MBE9039885.1 type II/IV secretion system protein [Zarconia navalis LEGE 11467]